MFLVVRHSFKHREALEAEQRKEEAINKYLAGETVNSYEKQV
jgi:hypothetical protein